jgi:hypothetical protein
VETRKKKKKKEYFFEDPLLKILSHKDNPQTNIKRLISIKEVFNLIWCKRGFFA